MKKEITLGKRYKYAGDVFEALVYKCGFSIYEALNLLNSIQDSDVVEREKLSKWIPTSQRLPDKDEEYIVTINCASESTSLFYDVKYGWYDIECNFYDVTAWQPLPDPYKE